MDARILPGDSVMDDRALGSLNRLSLPKRQPAPRVGDRKRSSLHSTGSITDGVGTLLDPRAGRGFAMGRGQPVRETMAFRARRSLCCVRVADRLRYARVQSNLASAFVGDLGVDFGVLDGAVSEQILDIADIDVIGFEAVDGDLPVRSLPACAKCSAAGRRRQAQAGVGVEPALGGDAVLLAVDLDAAVAEVDVG
jgi:hypothetical protein